MYNQTNNPFFEFISSLDKPSADQPRHPLAAFFDQEGCQYSGPKHAQNYTSDYFIPAADVFDTPTSYVVHVSLPGALKEDLGINYDEDNSELQITGVIHRPGDEEFLKTMSRGERKIGLFEKKVKLAACRSRGLGGGGNRKLSDYAEEVVDTDSITARLDNGVLVVKLLKKKKKELMGEEKMKVLVN